MKKPLNSIYVGKENISLKSRNMYRLKNDFLKVHINKSLFLNHDKKTKTKGHFGIFLKKTKQGRKEKLSAYAQSVVAPIKA